MEMPRRARSRRPAAELPPLRGSVAREEVPLLRTPRPRASGAADDVDAGPAASNGTRAVVQVAARVDSVTVSTTSWWRFTCQRRQEVTVSETRNVVAHHPHPWRRVKVIASDVEFTCTE